MRKVANNTFNGGLLMDLQPLTTPNSVLTDCLNGTIITYDGNEFVLQGDDGNCRVVGCRLPKDFIPLGMKEYGGIIYIVSKNPFTGECEIGSFPSPERIVGDQENADGLKAELDFNTIFNYNNNSSTYKSNGLSTTTKIAELGNIDYILRPGDKFILYSNSDDSTLKDLCQEYNDQGDFVSKRLLNIKVLRMTQSGESEDISDVIKTELMGNNFLWLTKSNYDDYINTAKIDGLWAVYNNKINGYLVMSIELEQIDDFSLNLNTISTDNEDAYKLILDYTSIVSDKSYNNVSGVKVEITNSDNNSSVLDADYSIVPALNDSNTPIKYKNSFLPPEEYYTEIQIDKELDKNINYQVEITPFSRFNFFENLKYITNVNYQKLNYQRESLSWKYYFDQSTDEDVTPDKMRVSFDFFVRNTLNGRNKLDLIYLEFYDVISGTSLFYPLNNVSDTKSLNINCFKSQEKTTKDLSYIGPNATTTVPYYALIDLSYKAEYDAIVNGISETTTTDEFKNITEINESKLIPKVYKLESLFGATKRFNNLCAEKEKYNRLRSNSFYIVGIVGLDFYSTDNKTLDPNSPRKFYAINYMWTNGVFNKYWTSENYDNFNEIDYPLFYQFKLVPTSNSWTDNTFIADAVDVSASEVDDKSYQNYSLPYTTSIRTTNYTTKIHLDGTISKQYQIEASYIPAALNYGDLHIDWELGQIDTTISSDDYTVEEENNYSDDSMMETNSKIDTFSTTLTEDNKTSPFTVTYGIFSNRRVIGYVGQDYLTIKKYKAVKFTDAYGDISIFNRTPIIVGPLCRDKETCCSVFTNGAFKDNTGLTAEGYVVNLYGENGDNTDVVKNGSIAYNNTKIRQKLNNYSGPGLVQLTPKRFEHTDHSDFGLITYYHGSGYKKDLVNHPNDTYNIYTFASLNQFNTKWSLPTDGEPPIRQITYRYLINIGAYENDFWWDDNHNAFETEACKMFTVYIPDDKRTGSLVFANVAYRIEGEDAFNNYINAVENNIKSCYVTRLDDASNNTECWIATSIINHNNFNTTFNINQKLATTNVKSAEVYLDGVSLTSKITSALNSINLNGDNNIGTLKSVTQNCIPKAINNSQTDLYNDDVYTINYSRFILNNQSINAIVTTLQNPQASISDVVLSDQYNDYLYPSEYRANNPTTTSPFAYYRYNSASGLYCVLTNTDNTDYMYIASERRNSVTASLQAKMVGFDLQSPSDKETGSFVTSLFAVNGIANVQPSNLIRGSKNEAIGKD